MSGRRSSPVIREGEDIVGGQHRKYSDSNIAMMRPTRSAQSHISM